MSKKVKTILQYVASAIILLVFVFIMFLIVSVYFLETETRERIINIIVKVFLLTFVATGSILSVVAVKRIVFDKTLGH